MSKPIGFDKYDNDSNNIDRLVSTADNNICTYHYIYVFLFILIALVFIALIIHYYNNYSYFI